MPFSELKIDQSFVSELAASNEARTIVRTIIQLAHNLNMTVCAEGVETAEILEFLTEEGCDKAQGHYIARALHPRGFFNFASQHRPNWSAPIIAHPGRRTH